MSLAQRSGHCGGILEGPERRNKVFDFCWQTMPWETFKRRFIISQRHSRKRKCALINYTGWNWENNNHKAGVYPHGLYAYGFRQRVERSQGRDPISSWMEFIWIAGRLAAQEKAEQSKLRLLGGREALGIGTLPHCTDMRISGYRIKVEPYQDSWRANSTERIFDLEVTNRDDTGINSI